MSDYATPDGNHFSAYGCHTFRWVNKEGQAVFVKYHYQPHHPKKRFNFEESVQTSGIDPDYAKRQMFETIEGGGSFKWTMLVQVMTPEEASTVDFDPFDVTKVWPRGELI